MSALSKQSYLIGTSAKGTYQLTQLIFGEFFLQYFRIRDWRRYCQHRAEHGPALHGDVGVEPSNYQVCDVLRRGGAGKHHFATYATKGTVNLNNAPPFDILAFPI